MHIKTKEHKYYFDYLRVLASLMVIIVHITSYPYIIRDTVGANIAFFSHLNLITAFNTSARSGVPVFFMISGALLLNPSYIFNFKKSFLRLFFPLTIWSILGALLINYYDDNFNLKNALTLILFHAKRPQAVHFWYLYTLIGVYFILNILKKMINNLEQKDYQHILVIWLIFSVLASSIAYYIPLLSLSGYKVSFPTDILGLFFLGYYLDKYSNTKVFTNKKIMIIVIGVLTIGLLVPWVLTWYHNLHSLNLVDLYFSNFNIFVIIQAVLLFVLVKHLMNRYSLAIAFLAKLSFTAYCSHILIMNFLDRSPILKVFLSYLKDIAPTVEMLFKFAFVSVFSYLIAYLLYLLPKRISYYFGI